MNFKGAIFDFDGVVVDSTPLHYRAWKRLVTEDFNTPFDHEVYEEAANGRRSADVIPHLLPQLTTEQKKEALTLKQNYYHEQVEDGKLKVFASTIKLIEELVKQNIKTAVASSSRSVAYVLKKADILHLFDVIICGHDTKCGKPHPESFLLAAERLSLPSSECIVFEDAKVGVQAAKAGGFRCIGIDRIAQPDNLKQADLCINDISEITLKHLDQLFIK